jgi:D-alanyl-D-alanine dipeptidase
VGRPVYEQARAFLQRPAAEALSRVQTAVRADGYTLIVYDAYRPWSITKLFWDAATSEQRRIGFVADPARGSRHNRGCAVDVTLGDLASGQALPMPSGYDEFNERAHADYAGVSAEARRNRDYLRRAMEQEGYVVLPEEWWHYDYRDWREYPVLDVPFEAIPPGAAEDT